MGKRTDLSVDLSVRATGKEELSKAEGMGPKNEENRKMFGWPHDELAKRLLAKGLLTSEGLEKAFGVAEETQKKLVEVITSMNLVPKRVAYEELAGIYGVPFIDLRTYVSDPEVVSLVEEKTARELEIFPIFTIGDSLTVACVDPSDITVLDHITAASKHNVESCLAVREDIREAINRTYGGSGKVKEFLDKLGEDESGPKVSLVDAQKAILQSSESPVSQLVDLIVTQAVRDRASDIHVDPEEDSLSIRFRIDGVLYEVPPPPKHLHSFIISRTKVISNMNIAETRLPQDGHFEIAVDGRLIEARVSSMPTIYGENLAIRILDTHEMSIALENLGVPVGLLYHVDEMIRRPHGMIVVTGPTGSGKSTTLYAMLAKSKSAERNIVTIEDPVERRMKKVSQVQISEKSGMTFASALRSILRQDPDVIMVGEIRDQETAHLAVRAALTGHLIFSTIHTNDAPGAVTRLVDMGIEPFLVSSSLIGVVGQRLCRRICEECKEPGEVPVGLRHRLAASGVTPPGAAWKGRGCSNCRDTGYHGRIAVFELMPVTLALADLISENAPLSQLRAQALKDGMTTMLKDSIDKVEQGVTTLEEALRVAELQFVSDFRPVVGAEPAEDEPKTVKESLPGASETVSESLDDYKRKIGGWLAGKTR